MNESTQIPNIDGYVTIKEAANMLGLADRTVYEYVAAGRIQAVKAADILLIPLEEVQKFKPNISGRPRTTIPQWRISPNDNALQHTFILVQLRPGKLAEFRRKLDGIRRKKEHVFPGTIARFILGRESQPEQVIMLLIWRLSVMPDEVTRTDALEAFKLALDDVVDWSTAQIDDGTVFMHA